MIGNSLLAQARQHSLVAEQLIASIVQELTGAAIAARQRVVAEAERATRLSQIIVAAAVIIGSLLTFLVLRSIVVPLRRLTEAMAGLNAGDVDVPIPEAGRDEIGAVAQTLALFRDTLKELRETLAQLEALRAVGRAVGSTLDLERVLSTVVARAVEFAHAQAGMIYEFDDAAREFRFRSSHGAEPELTEELRAAPIRHGEGAISAAAITGSPAQVRDLLTERQITLPKFVEALARRGYRSLIAAPLLHEEDVLGGLVIARREAGEFSKQVVSLIALRFGLFDFFAKGVEAGFLLVELPGYSAAARLFLRRSRGEPSYFRGAAPGRRRCARCLSGGSPSLLRVLRRHPFAP